MNQETTSLSELPIQPGSVGGGSGGGEQNIVMTTSEKQSTSYSPNVPGVSDQPQPNGTRGPPQGGAYSHKSLRRQAVLKFSSTNVT